MPENNSNPSFREQVNTYFPLQPGKMNMAAFLTGVGTPVKGQYIQNAIDFGSQGVAAFLMGLQGAKDRQQDAFNPEAQTYNPETTPTQTDQIILTTPGFNPEQYVGPPFKSPFGLGTNALNSQGLYPREPATTTGISPASIPGFIGQTNTLKYKNGAMVSGPSIQGAVSPISLDDVAFDPTFIIDDLYSLEPEEPLIGLGDNKAFSREAGDSMDDTGEGESPNLLTELMKADVFRTNTPVESLYNMGSILGTKTSDLTDRYGKFGKAIKPMGATASGLSAALQSAKSFAAGEGLTNRSQYVRDRNLEEMRRMLTEQGQEMGRQDMFNDEYLRYYGAGFKDGGEKQGLIEVEPGTYYNPQTDEFLIQD